MKDGRARKGAANASTKASWSLVRGRLDAARQSALARNARLLSDDATLATIACSTSAPGSVTSYPASPASVADYDRYLYNEGAFECYTGGVLYGFGARNDPAFDWTTGTGSGGRTIGSMIRYGLETNAPLLYFKTDANGGKKPRFLVNDQYVNKAGHTPAQAAQGPQYWSVTFADSRVRKIAIEYDDRIPLYTVMIPQGTNYYAVNRPLPKPRLLVIGDSFVFGPGVGSGIASDATLTMQGDGMYQHAGDWLGVEVVASGVNGTGFTKTNGSFVNTYPDRWGDVAAINGQRAIDALHIHGSVNDIFGTPANVQATVTSYLLQAIAAYPSIPITISGCFQSVTANQATSTIVEAAISAAVSAVIAQTGTRRLAFIPIQGTLPYVPTWPASGSASSLISSDGHPSPTVSNGVGGGHETFGRRMARDIHAAWMAMS